MYSSNRKNFKNNYLLLSRNKNKRSTNKYKQYAHKKISKKYTTPQTYLINIINNIIYNEKTHVVAKFKDYLILDDNSEFLKRYYRKYESNARLPKFFEYYGTYSKIYPNYTSLQEGKFIYKNIQKKQRMIDLQEQMEIKNKKKYSINSLNEEEKENDVFSTDVIHSILNETNKEDIETLFNINRDNLVKEEKIFYEKVYDIIETIEKYKNANNNVHSVIHLDNNSPKKNKSPNKNCLNKNDILLKKYYNLFASDLKGNITSKKLIKNKNNSMNMINKVYKKNLQSNKNSNKNLNNEDNNSKTDRTLIEKLENNFLQLSKKNLLFSKKNSSNTQRESKREHSSMSKSNISLNSQKIKNTKLPSKNIGQKSLNINSVKNFKIPLTYRINKIDHLISSNETYIKSPLTNRSSSGKSISNQKNNINITSIKNKIINLNNNNPNNSSSKKITNNIIYIINQNPFPTNINFYNNNINQIFSNNNININKPNSSRTLISKKNQTNINSKKKNNDNGSSKEKKDNNLNNKNKIQKRNQSTIINSASNNLLMTSRDVHYKEINLIKNSLKGKRDKSNKNNNSTYNNKNKDDVKINLKQQSSVSRNKKLENYNQNGYSINKGSESDSLSKVAFIDVIHMKKNIIKGINIKNFSKVFNVNISQSKNDNNNK